MDISKIIDPPEDEEDRTEHFPIRYHTTRRFAGSTCLESTPMPKDDSSSDNWKLNEGGSPPTPIEDPYMDWHGKHWWAEHAATTEAARNTGSSNRARRQPGQQYQELYLAGSSLTYTTNTERRRFAQPPATQYRDRKPPPSQLVFNAPSRRRSRNQQPVNPNHSVYHRGAYPSERSYQQRNPATASSWRTKHHENRTATIAPAQAPRQTFHRPTTGFGTEAASSIHDPQEEIPTPNTAAQRVFRTPEPPWKYIPPGVRLAAPKPCSTHKPSPAVARGISPSTSPSSQPNPRNPSPDTTKARPRSASSLKPSTSLRNEILPAKYAAKLESQQDLVALAGEHGMLVAGIRQWETYLDGCGRLRADSYRRVVLVEVKQPREKLGGVEEMMRREVLRRKELGLGLGAVMAMFDWLVEQVWD
ncbi:hypothetical protein BP6252_02750 [Coleophoma cylindrospora]|uniref:Uncharacterized protein n=1 Tax=Coleophoma cylindrospora TaxID=1849047 RepID=A0A3D8SFN7_9HELO|nr:hypothetical protein BP6252_02750 [Coleophoma cylindrospora]